MEKSIYSLSKPGFLWITMAENHNCPAIFNESFLGQIKKKLSSGLGMDTRS